MSKTHPSSILLTASSPQLPTRTKSNSYAHSLFMCTLLLVTFPPLLLLTLPFCAQFTGFHSNAKCIISLLHGPVVRGGFAVTTTAEGAQHAFNYDKRTRFSSS